MKITRVFPPDHLSDCSVVKAQAQVDATGAVTILAAAAEPLKGTTDKTKTLLRGKPAIIYTTQSYPPPFSPFANPNYWFDGSGDGTGAGRVDSSPGVFKVVLWASAPPTNPVTVVGGGVTIPGAAASNPPTATGSLSFTFSVPPAFTVFEFTFRKAIAPRVPFLK